MSDTQAKPLTSAEIADLVALAESPRRARAAACRCDGRAQMSRAYIKQRGENDCGFAALAMACDVSYERVADGLIGLGSLRLSEATENGAINDGLVKAWLCNNGFAWQEVTRNLWVNKGYVPVAPWPPYPFATTHICFVEATRGWHYCVLDFDGSVRDPWNAERHSLSHPDYKRVASVTGIFRLGQRRDTADATAERNGGMK